MSMEHEWFVHFFCPICGHAIYDIWNRSASAISLANSCPNKRVHDKTVDAFNKQASPEIMQSLLEMVEKHE